MRLLEWKCIVFLMTLYDFNQKEKRDLASLIYRLEGHVFFSRPFNLHEKGWQHYFGVVFNVEYLSKLEELWNKIANRDKIEEVWYWTRMRNVFSECALQCDSKANGSHMIKKNSSNWCWSDCTARIAIELIHTIHHNNQTGYHKAFLNAMLSNILSIDLLFEDGSKVCIYSWLFNK